MRYNLYKADWTVDAALHFLSDYVRSVEELISSKLLDSVTASRSAMDVPEDGKRRLIRQVKNLQGKTQLLLNALPQAEAALAYLNSVEIPHDVIDAVEEYRDWLEAAEMLLDSTGSGFASVVLLMEIKFGFYGENMEKTAVRIVKTGERLSLSELRSRGWEAVSRLEELADWADEFVSNTRRELRAEVRSRRA